MSDIGMGYGPDDGYDEAAPDDAPQITADTSMRMTALHLAVEFCDTGFTGEDAVEIAGTFLAFLRGDTPA